MPKSKDTLARIEVTRPCTASWDEMKGNDEVRFCHHCQLDVHNFSVMTRREVIRLVARSRGRLCMRYYQRPDRSIQTAPPAHLYQLSRRASRLAAGTAAAALALSANALTARTARADSPLLTDTEIHARMLLISPELSGGEASLTGKVLDPVGEGLGGASVTLIAKESRQEWVTVSDAEGVFTFKFLDAGDYILKASSEGFSEAVRDDIQLKSGEEMDLQVQVGFPSVTVGGGGMALPELPLASAALREEPDEVRSLIAAGAPLNEVDKEYEATALSLAVSSGNLEIVELLLSFGADVNVKEGAGRTTLLWLNEESTPELVRALVYAGADPQAKDTRGATALMWIASHDNALVMQALIDAGAKVNPQDENGQTALMYAAASGHVDNVSVLLRAGAEVNLRDKEGKTALDIALEHEADEIIELLKSYGAVE